MSADKTDGATTEILVVEDSKTQADQLSHTLEQAGYRVRNAANGAEALAAIRQSRPHLIISDVVMPVMDGYAMCRAVKDDKKLSDIPVVILTSLLDSRDVIRGVDAGVDYFLTKPYQAEALLLEIRTVLASSSTQEPADTAAGTTRVVRSNRQGLLTLLLATHESSVRRNKELIETQTELETLNGLLAELLGQLKEQVMTTAEEANRAKSTFLANISHEIRTPTNAVIRFTSLARNTELTSEQKGRVSRIHDAGVAFLEMVNVILAKSRGGP